MSDREAFEAWAEDLIRSVGMDSGLMDMGAASCIYSEGCEGVTVSDLHRILQAATAHERERIQDAISIALQGDLENGVKWLNEAASCKFRKEYPALAKLIGDGLEDGRALREAIRCAK